MIKKIAIVDIDGCLCEYPNPVFFSYVKTSTGLSFKCLDEMKQEIGIEKYDVLKANYRREGYKLHLDPLPGVVQAMHEIRNRGYEIIILTSRPNSFNVPQDTDKWLNKNDIPFDKLFFVDEKETFLFSINGHQVIVIDDNYSGLINYANSSHVKLFHYGENPAVDQLPDNYMRVNSWDQILQHCLVDHQEQ